MSDMRKGWVLVTGASSGIGAQLARIAARDGYDVVVSARSKEPLETLADEIRAGGQKVEIVLADLAIEGGADALWTAATDGREISILINNAGLGAHGNFADADGWAREYASMQVNAMSLMLLMKLAIRTMKSAGHGRILNVASTAAFMPGPGMAVYHASKAFVLSLSESVAYELRGSGVTVTALCPGATKTNFFADAKIENTRLVRAGATAVGPVAQAGWTGMMRAKRIVIPGILNKIIVFSGRITPRWLMTSITGFLWSK